jgi:hypothetical protein
MLMPSALPKEAGTTTRPSSLTRMSVFDFTAGLPLTVFEHRSSAFRTEVTLQILAAQLLDGRDLYICRCRALFRLNGNGE